MKINQKTNPDRSRLKAAFLTIEYAFLIVILVVALIGMAIYLKRAVSGGMREVGDSFGHGRQYDPGKTDEWILIKRGR